MAQKVEVLLIDDLDGGNAAETITFALYGVEYEIDLSEDNAEALRTALDPYVAAARRTSRGRGKVVARQGGTPKASRTHLPPDNRTIRAWAASRSIEVSARGRIAQAVIDRYMAEAG